MKNHGERFPGKGTDRLFCGERIEGEKGGGCLLGGRFDEGKGKGRGLCRLEEI